MKLWIDTETGGLNPKHHDLLTLAIVIEDKGRIIHTAEWGIKREEYRTTEGAMKVNKINLNDLHHDPAIVCKELSLAIKHFFKKDKPVIHGQNTKFDLGFIQEFLTEYGVEGESQFKDIFNQKYIFDLYPVATMLIEAKLLPKGCDNLGAYIKHFNLPAAERHTATEDAIMSAHAYNKILGIIKGERI